MPRDLADVIHYFLPELEPARPVPGSAALTTPAAPGADGRERDLVDERPGIRNRNALRRRQPRPSEAPGRFPLSLLGVPLGPRDLVYAAFTWNLAIETARHGGESLIVAPEAERDAPLWPDADAEILEGAVHYVPARGLEDLERAAAGIAEERSHRSRRGGVVFVCIPPGWLFDATRPLATIRWLLLFASVRGAGPTDTFERVRRLYAAHPGLEIGVTLHGVRRIDEARSAFDELARACEDRLGVAPISYGLLVDGIDLDRAIAGGRAVAPARPDAPAARALTDVARILYEDARSRVLG